MPRFLTKQLPLLLAGALCVLLTCSCTQAPEEAPATEASTQHEEVTIVEPTTPEVPADTSTLAGLLATGEVTSIRVIGDSITAGYLIDGYDAESDTGVVVYAGGEGTFTETPTTVACWTNAFRTYAHERGVASFVNAGVSGFRMQYLAEDPDAWLAEGADVIVVMLGTNDAAKESVEEFQEYAEQALQAAANRCTHLVVVSPPNNDRTDATNLYDIDQIDQVLTSVCAEHGWEHISLYDALELYSDDFFPDMVHPTAAGSQKLWEAFQSRLGLAA